MKVCYNVVVRGGIKIYSNCFRNYEEENMKKTLIVAAAVACAATTLAVAFPWGKKKAAAQGKVLNIYVWNEEFQSRFNDFYASRLPSDVKVNWVVTPNQGNAYQNKLDETLLAQDKAKADDKIDILERLYFTVRQMIKK